MQLPELQQRFASAIVKGDAGMVAGSIRSDGIPAAARLNVYHNNVIGNLADALADTFSATRKLVGDDFFRAMAEDFIPQHLPQLADLNRYGAALPEFIRCFAPAGSLPYLPDVAQFEWCWNEAFLAGDDTALLPAALADISAEEYPGLRLRFRTSARLMASAWPVDAIWRFCESGGNAPDMDAAGVHLLVLRPEVDVEAHRLSHIEYNVLQALAVGSTVEEAFALVADGFDTAEFFSRHFALGTFTAIR